MTRSQSDRRNRRNTKTDRPENTDILYTLTRAREESRERGEINVQEEGRHFSPVAPVAPILHTRIPGKRCSPKQASFIRRLAGDCILDVNDLLARRGVTCADELSQGEARQIIDWCLDADRHAAEYPREFIVDRTGDEGDGSDVGAHDGVLADDGA